MASMKSLRSFALGLGLGLLLAATPLLRAQDVNTDWDRNIDFSQFHTFSFYRVLTTDPLYKPRIQDAVTRNLEAKGLELVPSGGDLGITAIGNVRNTQEYSTFYNGLGPGYGWRGWGWWGGTWGGPLQTTVQNIPVGTLMLDLYDSRTHNLVFRGRASGELNTKNSDKNIAKLNKAVDKMFGNFPPKAR